MDARRKKRQGLVVEALPIFGQATAAVEPGDGALDDPAFGQDHKSADPTGAFDDFNVEMRQNFCKRFRKFRPLISAVGEERLQKGKHPEQCRHNEDATIAILNVGRMNDDVEQRPNGSTRMCLFLPLIFLPASYPCGSMHAPFSALFTLWLSMMAAVGLASRYARSRHC
jgi:hypothetical protein